LVTLAIAVGPLVVVAAATLRGTQCLKLTRLDLCCLSLAIAGIILWMTTKDPLLALLMSVVADLFASTPTVVKSYVMPHTESAASYSLSIISMIVTLLTIRQWRVMSWAFPSYILLINLTFVTLILLPKQLRSQRSMTVLAGSAPANVTTAPLSGGRTRTSWSRDREELHPRRYCGAHRKSRIHA
jgi:di/tricarboxylate transporter